MCFSAQASFAAGIGLSLIGILTLKKNKDKKMRLFAAVPLLFGIQQICEGFVWMTQDNPELIMQNEVARYAFLFFAFLMWPVWVPLAGYISESDAKKKRCLAAFLGIGSVVSSCLLWTLVMFGATSEINCSHIAYSVNLPTDFESLSLVWYCIATMGPLFVVKRKRMCEFGMLLIVSVFASYYFFTTFFTSVWCFFAALLSIMMYSIV